MFLERGICVFPANGAQNTQKTQAIMIAQAALRHWQTKKLWKKNCNQHVTAVSRGTCFSVFIKEGSKTLRLTRTAARECVCADIHGLCVFLLSACDKRDVKKSWRGKWGGRNQSEVASGCWRIKEWRGFVGWWKGGSFGIERVVGSWCGFP